MKNEIEQRVLQTATYLVEHRATVRRAAHVFGVSKSTVHKDMTERLPHMNAALAAEVAQVLAVNKAERHVRGGQATYLKFKGSASHLEA